MSHRLTKEELDEQFELFLKESISDDSVDLGGTSRTSELDSLGKVLQNPAHTTGPSQLCWNEDEETLNGGLLASGKIFRKSQRKSLSVQEEDEVQLKPKRNQNVLEKEEVKEEQAEAVIFSRYSVEPKDSESVAATGAGPNTTAFGLDTLDEEKEKADFFANLERGASSTIDYSKLNRELDSPGSTVATTLKNAEKIVTELESKESHESRSMPATLNYSEDFEDGLGGREAQDEKISRPGMLAKVSFHDSLDSTAGTQKPEEGAKEADVPVRNDGCLSLGVMETNRTAQFYGQSGASEMEALQEAYRQIGLFIGDSADHVQDTSSRSENSHPLPAPEYSRGTFKATFCTESDLPTAEELMRPIRPDLGFTQLSSQHPVIGDSTGMPQGCRISTSAEGLLRGAAGGSTEGPPLGTGDWTDDEKHRDIMEEKKSSVHQVKNKRALPGSHSQASVGNLADRHAELGLTVSDGLVSSVQSSATSLEQRVQQREHEACGEAQDSDARYSRRLHYLEEVSKKVGWSIGKSSDPITNEKLKLIEKELNEQETLIQGYHQENAKLYHQVKALKSQSKEKEEAMFMVNQRLQVELAMAREEIKRSCTQRTAGNDFEQNIGIADQMQALQESEARLTEEIRRLKHEKQALEVDVGMGRKEMDSGDKNFDIKMLEEQHKQEVQALNRRLQWYIENQKMLDREVGQLRATTEETHKLKEQVQQVDKLKYVVGKKNSQEQKKVKERMGDAKRILDLKKQVKKMEDILKCKNPNSLPALIWAAASAAGSGCTEQTETVSFLERRVRRLEEDLETKDEEAKQSMRAMEQQYHKIKIQYEQHISELEEQLSKKSLTDQTGTCKDSESKARALEQELQSLRETHKKQVSTLRAEVDALRDQVEQSGCREQTPKKSPSKHDHQAEMAKGLRIKSLTQELAAKTKTVQDLTRTVERLQRERRSLLSVSAATAHSKEPVSAARESSTKAQTFPVTLNEKSYQPLTFSGSHISEVLQENDHLKACLQHMELKNEQERVAKCQVEKELHRVREDAVEQLSLLKTECQRERESLIAQHALEHSSSKVAELTNQLSTQEIIIRHLQDQVKELQGCKEALAVSHIREETLQKEMEKLLKELKEAKEMHTPQLKHFTSLETKIKNMELRHRERERELQQVIAKTLLVAEEQQQQEVEAWRKLAQGRTRELENFRTELDSILDVLRELQRQGVVIPVNGAVHLT